MPCRACLLAVLLAAPGALAQESPSADPDAGLLAALANDKTFLRGEYRVVRSAFSTYFEQKYATDIRAAFGKESELTVWLAATPEVKETLYTAIDPEHDPVGPALEVFRDLFKHAPDKVKALPNVAVAAAVTWDDPKAIYDYRGHAFRTGSTLPPEVSAVGPVQNFEHLAKLDGQPKAAVQALPWEFLVHVVNHRTPEAERDWAVKTYTRRRAGIGASYKDVEYDTVMLRTELARGPGKGDCRLGGKEYTLANIEQFGGVCAMQADFAARVAKSLAVPAEYVGGESNSGGRHAWVMWVEVKAVQRDKVDFALLSEGRYLGDQYYVGDLKDPKSGAKITDRDMERRLTFIGNAPQAARQADLLMRAFPVVRDKKGLTTAQQLAYIRRVLEIFPASERAWLTLAELYRDKKLTDPNEALPLVDRAFTVFANFPDFSWKLADDLLTPVTDKVTRGRKFEILVNRYEALSRPDLACEARLKLVEYQVEAKDYKRAADGLMQTVRKFPAEGRYVPKMMDKLRELAGAKEYRGGVDQVARFYLEILPRVPKLRGSEVSQYAVKMYEEAVEFLEANKKTREAALVKQQLTLLKRK